MTIINSRKKDVKKRGKSGNNFSDRNFKENSHEKESKFLIGKGNSELARAGQAKQRVAQGWRKRKKYFRPVRTEILCIVT